MKYGGVGEELARARRDQGGMLGQVWLRGARSRCINVLVCAAASFMQARYWAW
jgi:hypothetical protein